MTDTVAAPRPETAAQKRIVKLVTKLATSAVEAWDGSRFPNTNLRDNADQQVQTWVCQVATEDQAIGYIADILRCCRCEPGFGHNHSETSRSRWQPQIGPTEQAPSELHQLLSKWLKGFVWSKAASLSNQQKRQPE